MKINQYGMSLIESLLGLGLVGFASLGVMKVQENMQRVQLTTEAKMSELEIKRIVSNNFLDKKSCFMTFVASTIGTPITQIKNNLGSVIYETGKIYDGGNIKITQMRTEDKNVVNLDGTRNIDFVITLERVKNLTFGKAKEIRIPLSVNALSALAPIQSCLSDTDSLIKTAKEETCLSMNGTWDDVLSKCSFDAFKIGNQLLTKFVVASNGNVGVGTDSPSVKFEVNGAIRPGSLGIVAGAACDAEGSMAYDQILHAPVFCSSLLKWKQIGTN